MLIDTHCHLGDAQFDHDREDVLARAHAADVGHVIVIADSLLSTTRAIDLARRHRLSATAGVHPHEASSWAGDTPGDIEAVLGDEAVVAVGETGLDYHYDHSPRADQRKAFADQLALAAKHDLPAVVHSRSADDDMAAMLRDTDAVVILHSFSAGESVFDVALARRAYVSFSGMVTFRSWVDFHAVTATPADRILVETDAPYLAPVPHRGRRNEPAFVRLTAERISTIRGVSPETLAQQTTSNAEQCFGRRVTTSSSDQ